MYTHILLDVSASFTALCINKQGNSILMDRLKTGADTKYLSSNKEVLRDQIFTLKKVISDRYAGIPISVLINDFLPDKPVNLYRGGLAIGFKSSKEFHYSAICRYYKIKPKSSPQFAEPQLWKLFNVSDSVEVRKIDPAKRKYISCYYYIKHLTKHDTEI